SRRPLRSVISPRAGTIGRGLMRLASERSWYSSCCSTCRRKYAVASPSRARAMAMKPTMARRRNCAASALRFLSLRRGMLRMGSAAAVAGAQAQAVEQQEQPGPERETDQRREPGGPGQQAVAAQGMDGLVDQAVVEQQREHRQGLLPE